MMISVIDLTRIEEVSIEDLNKWISEVTTMYDRCLEKENIGAANAMYVIKHMIQEEIYSRKEKEKSNNKKK